MRKSKHFKLIKTSLWQTIVCIARLKTYGFSPSDTLEDFDHLILAGKINNKKKSFFSYGMHGCDKAEGKLINKTLPSPAMPLPEMGLDEIYSPEDGELSLIFGQNTMHQTILIVKQAETEFYC